MIQKTIEINFKGLHFTVDITGDSFLTSKFRITNQDDLSYYIEQDLEFQEMICKMLHKVEEREERNNDRRIQRERDTD